MKKVLFATTALVGFAGAAAAEVSLSGFAEMGVKGGDAIETQLHNDIDVTFNLSGETDGGLAFGATIDLDEVTNTGDDNGIPDGANDASAFISGEFGKLTIGETDGALDWALTETAMLTAIADDHTAHDGYNGNGSFDGVHDGQIARYEYSFGDFAFGVSAEMDDTAGGDDPSLGVGVKYSGAMGGVDYGVGVAFQSIEDAGVSYNTAGISANVASNGFSAVVNYVDWDAYSGNDSYSSIGVGYTTGALSLHANYGTVDKVAAPDVDGYGLAVNYDLGGGAVAALGYGHDDTDSTWSAGLSLSF